MKIYTTNVDVDDQQEALRFYTAVLGFENKTEIPLGEVSWLTLVSLAAHDGAKLLLKPDRPPVVGPFKTALAKDDIPFTSFADDDVHAEYERLSGQGVRFTQPSLDVGAIITAVFDDPSGNVIQIATVKRA